MHDTTSPNHAVAYKMGFKLHFQSHLRFYAPKVFFNLIGQTNLQYRIRYMMRPDPFLPVQRQEWVWAMGLELGLCETKV